MSISGEATAAPVHEDVVSALGSNAKSLFVEKKNGEVEGLQNLLDALTAKVAGMVFEVFREPFDELLRLLRDAYGQIARFVEGDFRQHPSFYLGQLHSLAEVAYRVGHQRVPREAVDVVARSRVASEILRKVVAERSIGAADLARELNIEESNLSATCRPLVENELLRRDRFGKRVRYSPTPLTYAVVAQLRAKTPASSTEGGPESTKVAAAAAARGIVSHLQSEAAALATRSAGGPPDWPTLAAAAAAAVAFLASPDPEKSKSKARVAFREIQEEKTRLEDFERIYIQEILEGCRWKTSKAAEVLGIGRPKLTSLMKKLAVEP